MGITPAGSEENNWGTDGCPLLTQFALLLLPVSTREGGTSCSSKATYLHSRPLSIFTKYRTTCQQWMHTKKLWGMHVYVCARVHTVCTHTHTHHTPHTTHTHTTHARTHTRTHTRMHTRMHTCTYARTHTLGHHTELAYSKAQWHM